MIVLTMTATEILSELDDDLKEMLRVCDGKDRAFRRLVLKTSRFPLYVNPIYHTTRRRNRWALFLMARSRRDAGESLAVFVCLVDTPCGLHALMPTFTDGIREVNIYTSHFFRRYRERFAPHLASGAAAIEYYFRENYNYAYTFREPGEGITEVFGSGHDGVAMGLRSVAGGINLFKTFVTYPMLKGRQIDVFGAADEHRRELHEAE